MSGPVLGTGHTEVQTSPAIMALTFQWGQIDSKDEEVNI